MPDLAPTVFIVDAEPSVRDALTAIVRSAGWQSQAFSSTAAFLNHPVDPGPSCLLLDSASADLDPLSVLKCLVAERSEMRVIMISEHGDVPLTVQAMRAGAIEFLVKPLVADLVVHAVEEALAQSDELFRRDCELQELRGRYDSLSCREREVMLLVIGGSLNKQVGGRLGISEITVKAHRGKVMRKMAANSLAELVGLAIRLNLSPVLPLSVWAGAASQPLAIAAYQPFRCGPARTTRRDRGFGSHASAALLGARPRERFAQ